jgi:prolipoprotein diacylglyceryltransferase
MVQYSMPIWEFFAIWKGGLVFYGSIVGGLVGFLLAYVFFLRKHHVPAWKTIDVVACCLALGLLLGRVGCLLNGCCYGNVACADCPAISFPAISPPGHEMVKRGHQTLAGFTMLIDQAARPVDRRTVAAVEPGSAAKEAGLQAGDILVKINGGDPMRLYADPKAMRGTKVEITVKRDGKDVDLPAFTWPGSGFTLIDCTVAQVEPWSPAAAQGLRDGDVIVQINEHRLVSYSDLIGLFAEDRPRGLENMQLTVVRGSNGERTVLPAFQPLTLGLHPTQIYESISMALLLALLLAFYPLRGRPGMVMVLAMVSYAVHRFLNEMLRTDTRPVAFDMTLSQNISVIVLAGAVLLAAIIWLRRERTQPVLLPLGADSQKTVAV